MLRITILAVGKIKEKYFFEALKEYAKRLRPYSKIETVELKAEPFGASTKIKAQKIETERILSFLEKRQNDKVFVLDENGKNYTSREFAKIIDGSSGDHIVFVIGGSLGFASDILGKKWPKISLSRMTFPHEMARVLLMEQIYRAITIIKNKEYHY